ncbi:hsp90-like protein [Plectosphaerella plurivora]|uniref:Hsp90-like protein n=1 Tax=Plectosphaerella plurivora TaxID=936078 RepID=A0A9P8VD01_9PEZI|nr:hsp90-like protein [Plectosphaerella plurivora]
MDPSRRSSKNTSEAARERETFKYASSLIDKSVRLVATSESAPVDHLTSCSDTSLIAYAQLAVLRLNAKRALISLFDGQHQYVVAEATPTAPLTPRMAARDMAPGELWLCGTAMPRPAGVCARVLTDHDGNASDSTGTGPLNRPSDLPLTIIPDMTDDTRTADSLYCKGWPGHRFYAGVPIRTHRGIDIGFFCILDDVPREGLDDVSICLMRDLSSTIMSRLQARRSRAAHRRADRMVRGLGSFVEGQATMTGWQEDREGKGGRGSTAEGGLNENQQQLRAVYHAGDMASPIGLPLSTSPLPDNAMEDYMFPLAPSSATPVPSALQPDESLENTPASIDNVFAKAANIIRESIEVEGVLFLDASIGSFGGLATIKAGPRHRTSSSSSSSSEDDKSGGSTGSPDQAPSEDVMCESLGFSTSTSSSIDGTAQHQSHTRIPEKLLARLLHRYPHGKIFNFDEGGNVQTSDFSNDEVLSPEATESSAPNLQPSSTPESPQRSRPTKKLSAKRRFARQNEGKLMAGMFSGARSVMLIPVWDDQRERWFAGGFVYTKTPTRVFTVEGEMSYLRAFASVIMSEVARVKAISVDRAKTDLLSSLSHELRSPLHGVVLGVELLQDTPLDAFQGDVLHSVETCGRTLLDTMDHLLDWSKINNFVASAKKRGSRVKPGEISRSLGRRNSIEAGMMSITSDVDVALLTEEVVESICAGFNFQRFSLAELGGSSSSGNRDPQGLRRLDTMQAVENIITGKNNSGSLNIVLGDVAVGLDIDAGSSWMFRTQPGALRRIIMNILGNSLKYTSKGFVKVTLVQTTPSQTRGAHAIELTIVDSGQGISEDYLQNHLFSPFAQEDSLAAGAGLGLSLVKKITLSLGGSVQVKSTVGQGTTVRVKLPLQPTPTSLPGSSPDNDGVDEFEAQVTELQGLRVRLMCSTTTLGGKRTQNVQFSQHEGLKQMCHDWLRLQIIEPSQEKELLPDFVLCDEPNLNHAFRARRGNASVPVVVICSDPLVARRLSTSPAFSKLKSGVLEFVSQPVGPRKLAKILLLSFRRWTSSHSGRVNSSTLSGGSSERMLTGMSGTPDIPPVDIGMTPPPPPPETPMEVGDCPTPLPEPVAEPPLSDLQPDQEHVIATDLPVREAVAEPAAPVPPAPEGGPSSEQAPPKTATFLLVDDNPVNLKMISHHMKKLGHEFDTAMDGKQAYDAVREGGGRYKCIFMDISMPVMDGFEATRLIRRFEKGGHLPRSHIFALSGLASESAQQEAFASGIDLFLTKPVKLKELNRILGEKQLGTLRT